VPTGRFKPRLETSFHVIFRNGVISIHVGPDDVSAVSVGVEFSDRIVAKLAVVTSVPLKAAGSSQRACGLVDGLLSHVRSHQMVG